MIHLFAAPLTFKVKFCNPVTVVVCDHRILESFKVSFLEVIHQCDTVEK